MLDTKYFRVRAIFHWVEDDPNVFFKYFPGTGPSSIYKYGDI